MKKILAIHLLNSSVLLSFIFTGASCRKVIGAHITIGANISNIVKGKGGYEVPGDENPIKIYGAPSDNYSLTYYHIYILKRQSEFEIKNLIPNLNLCRKF